MRVYTITLFRSGRVWITPRENASLRRGSDILLVEDIEAQTETAALGKLLLKYVDAANQPHQHICPPCAESCCDLTCECGQPLSQHMPLMSPGHMFVERPQQHICPPCTRPHVDDPFNIEGKL